MRIKELYLPAYGCYTDFTLQLDEDKPFCLIYGDNETGKTTLLNAMLDFFYGIPAQTPYAYKHGTPAVGAQLLLADGQVLAYQKRKGGRKLLDYPGVECDLTAADKMPAQISKEAFTGLFALDHKNLRAGGRALASWQGSLAESMFTVASGINQLQQILDDLQLRQDEIYRPRGKKQILNALGIEYRHKLKEIREAEARVEDYRECEKRFNTSSKYLQNLGQDISDLKLYIKKLERKIELKPLIHRLRDNLEKRNALGEVVYLPPTLREERIATVKEREGVLKQQATLRIQIENLQDKIAGLNIPYEVLEEKVLIEEINQGWGLYKNNREELPVLKETQLSLKNQILEQLKEIAPQAQDVKDLEKLRLPLDSKERIKTLLAARVTLEGQIEKNQTDIKAAENKLAEFKRQYNLLPARVELSLLPGIISTVQAEGDQEKNLVTLKASLEEQRILWQQKIKALPLYSGTGEVLCTAKLPLAETIRKWNQELSARENTIKNTQLEKSKIIDEVKQINEEIELFAKQKPLYSEEDLYTARHNREETWKLVEKRLSYDYDRGDQEEAIISGEKLSTDYIKLVETADQIADTLWQNAELNHKWFALHHRREAAQARLQEITQQYKKLGEDYQVAVLAWESEWAKIPIDKVLTPEEMQGWLINANEIIKGFAQISNLNNQVNTLEKRIVQHKEAINQALAEVGLPTLHISLAGMIAQGQQILQEQNETNQQRKSLAERIEEIAAYLRELLSIQQDLQKEKDTWEKEWAEATAVIAGRHGLQAENAEKYLDKLDDLFALEFNRNENLQSIERLENRIERFTTQLRELLGRVKEDWLSWPLEKAWPELYSLFKQAEKDNVTLGEQRQQIAAKQEELLINEAELRELNIDIEGFLTQAQCADLEELPLREAASEKAMDLDKEIQTLKEEIKIHKNEFDYDEEELLALDSDEMKVELEDKQTELAQLEKEQLSATSQHAIIKAEYEDMLTNTSARAAQALQEAEEIQAEMHTWTEEYMKLNLAYRLLEESIQLYSQKNKATLIKRAGEIFSRLTLGSFKEIAVTGDRELAQVLIGIRPDGAEVKLEDMSAGTLDQLYLTLRLAYIEEHLRNNEPLPLIMDDLLINFDDRRAEETLKVLIEISQYTQIIFFTHNYHLLEIVKKVESGNLQIINLEHNLPA